MKNNNINKNDILLAYVGSVVPNKPGFHSPAFSPAGNMFQTNLLKSIYDNGLPPAMVLSQVPSPAYPKSNNILYGGGSEKLFGELPIILLPYINLPLIRPLSVGFIVMLRLLFWVISNRHHPNKIIYIFNLTEPSGIFVLLFKNLFKTKVIASINDINIPGETVPNSISRRVDYWLQKRLIPKFDGLIVVSQKIIDDFAPKTTFIRVEGAISQQVADRFLDSQKINRNNQSKTFNIVAAGSVDEANGILVLLEAFKYLDSNKFHLFIAGAGPLVNVVKEAASIDDRIQYCGYLPFEEVLNLYGSANLLINMRLTKSINTNYFFPSKTFEYLATGVPIISTGTGHIEEEFGDFIFLLQEETAIALSEKIAYVSDLPEKQLINMGRMAREYILINYTWANQGKRMVNFFQQLFSKC